MNLPPQDTRYALITGAASGLGRALAVRLARDGWCIAIADVDLEGARETLRLVEAAGGRGRVEALDVSQYDEWQALIKRLQADWPRLDMLINNAGVAGSGMVGAVPLENWRWLLEINLFGVIYGCHACLDWLKANPRPASVVNIASVAAVLAAPAMGAYNVAKAGVLALSETMACELYGSRVRVTVACPGFFRTRLLDRARFHTYAERAAAERLTSSAPMKVEAIADTIVRAAARGRLHVFLPARARLVWYFRRLAPVLWVRLLGRLYAKQLAQTPPDAAAATPAALPEPASKASAAIEPTAAELTAELTSEQASLSS